jgi:branched-chain amino acid transport system permease protein
METTRSNSKPDFFSKVLDKLCLSPLALIGLIILVVLPLVPPFNQQYFIRWMVAAALMAANCIAFDFTAGYINIVNFGYYAILGLGGYTSAIAATKLGISPWIGMFLGAIASGILGFLTGLLTLKLRGLFAAVMAWFVGLALMGLTTKLVWLTRGPLGLRSPQLFKTSSNLPYYYLILLLMFVTYLICRWATRTKMGIAFKAIAQNMEAARTSGINPVFYRIANFTMSCTLAGFLGGFYAHYYGILTPDVMHTSKTVEVLAVAYIGGRGSLWGGVFVAFPFLIAMEIIRSSLSNLPGLNLVVYGLLLIVIMIYYPGGFAQFFNTYLGRLKNKTLNYFMNGTWERA